VRKALEIGGVVAAAVLIVMGIATMVISAKGRQTVHNELSNQYIVGTPDMTPKAIQPEVTAIQATQKHIAAQMKAARAPAIDFTPVSAPSCSAAGETINTGAKARCFAQYMRIHALGGSNGLVYSQMGRYEAKASAPVKQTDFAGGTNNALVAVIDPKTSQPVANENRDSWVTETALSTALNTSYMAEQISMFGMVVGIALLLSGIGFAILAVGGALRNPDTALTWLHRPVKQEPTPATPA
jgi:hypothetical protein